MLWRAVSCDETMLRRAGGQLLKLALPALGTSTPALCLRGVQYFEAPNGPLVLEQDISEEWYNRQRNVMPLLGKRPLLQTDTWIAPNAVVVGDVDFYDQVCGSFCLLLAPWA